MQLRISNPLRILLIPIFLQISCKEPVHKSKIDKNKFEATTLEVDISNKDVLMILLAKDGTINREGSGVIDTAGNNYFIGMTKEPVFDSLMHSITDSLISYFDKPNSNCDTTKANIKVTATFDDKESTTGFEYCINGTQNDLPAPIREYIANAMRLTDPWYQEQKSMIKKK